MAADDGLACVRAAARSRGQALAAQGLADMDRAVTLAPNDISVRVPRAAALLPYGERLA